MCRYLSLFCLSLLGLAQEMPDNPATLVHQGLDLNEPLKVNDAIYQAVGFGNTFLDHQRGQLELERLTRAPDNRLRERLCR